MSSLVVIMFALSRVVDDRLLTPPAAAVAWFALLLMFDLLVCFARYSSLPPLSLPHLTVVNPISRFLHSNIASGPLPKGAIGVAMFVVQFPEISVFVGLVYTLNGIFGFARCYGIMATTTDHKFQMTMAFQFLCTIFLMIITQVSWAPGGAMAAAAPSIACLTF
jgi:hypothetical protein